MAGILEAAYRRSPVWLQNLGIAAYGYGWKRRRLGGQFLPQVERFLSRDRWSEEEWRAYQTEQLRAILLHAFRETEHYRRAWTALGIDEERLKQFRVEELPSLPFTEKEQIRQNPEDFIASSARRRKLHMSLTSGSTGTPLAVRMTSETHQTWLAAYEARCRRWAGVDYRMSRAMIGGRLVVPNAVSRPPFWRHNPVEKQLYFSAFHISPANAPHYAAALNRFRPDYLVGYASAHYFLARMFEEQRIEVYQPRAVLTSSEKLTDEMRATLMRVYSCEVFDAYSGVEPCCLASECERHRLHVSPDVGILELVDDDGRPAAPGQEGQVVATGLINYDQPLIRYRMGDAAIWSQDPCECGRRMPVLTELVGRLEDTVIGRDGRETVRFHGIFVGLSSIREGQVIQETLDRFTVRVVAPEGVLPADREAIATRFRQRLGDVQVEIVQVDQIERTERGKFRAVISRVRRGGSLR